MQSRTEKIIEYFQREKTKALIDSSDKGSIEINFSGDKTVPSIKIFDDIN